MEGSAFTFAATMRLAMAAAGVCGPAFAVKGKGEGSVRVVRCLGCNGWRCLARCVARVGAVFCALCHTGCAMRGAPCACCVCSVCYSSGIRGPVLHARRWRRSMCALKVAKWWAMQQPGVTGGHHGERVRRRSCAGWVAAMPIPAHPSPAPGVHVQMLSSFPCTIAKPVWPCSGCEGPAG